MVTVFTPGALKTVTKFFDRNRGPLSIDSPLIIAFPASQCSTKMCGTLVPLVVVVGISLANVL